MKKERDSFSVDTKEMKKEKILTLPRAVAKARNKWVRIQEERPFEGGLT